MHKPVFAASVLLTLASLSTNVSAADPALAQAQLNLSILGFDAGPVDGSWGGKTASAFTSFYAERGEVFDGKFDNNEIDALYDALSAIPLNGADERRAVNSVDWKTALPDFDFVPSRNIVAELPKVEAIVPFDQFSARIRAADDEDRKRMCDWYADGAPLPNTVKQLATYRSFREFETTANHVPHPGNIWIDDIKWIVSVVAEHTAGNRDPAALNQLHDAFLLYASRSAGLDTVHLLDPKTRQIIVSSDFARVTLAATSLTLSYLIAKPRLRFSADETALVERWLDRLFESLGDSYFALSPNSLGDPRVLNLVARATMANGILKNEPDTFNRGARMAATYVSLVRDDGSHRFGASRGNRALYYQGVSLDESIEDLLLMESQGLPARQLLLPNIERMAAFLARAHADQSVLWPYAQENNGVTVGSDYKVQDKIEAPNSLDMFFALSPNHPSVAALREIRKLNPYYTQITELFNGSCMSLGLTADLNAYQLAAEDAVKNQLHNATAYVRRTSSDDTFEGFNIAVFGEFQGKKFNKAFDLFSDYDGGGKKLEDLVLLRIAVPSFGLSAESAKADYSDCRPEAVRADGMPNIHFGYEEAFNACVFSHMTPEDVRLWSAVANALPDLMHKAGSVSDAGLQIEQLLVVKSPSSPTDGL